MCCPLPREDIKHLYRTQQVLISRTQNHPENEKQSVGCLISEDRGLADDRFRRKGSYTTLSKEEPRSQPVSRVSVGRRAPPGRTGTPSL